MVPMPGNAASDPPAEPVLKVESREELVYLLGQACEIEQGLMCEYLYAQFSLKRGLDEGRSASGRSATSSTWSGPRGWRWMTRPGSRPPSTLSR